MTEKQALADQQRPELPEDQEHEVSLGNEIHGSIYFVAGLAYIWFMLVAWFVFSANGGIDYNLAIATLIVTIFMGLALLSYTVARSHLHRRLPTWDEFVTSKIPVATGSLSGWEAGLQIMIIPLALGFAATALGLVFALTPSG